MQKKGTVLFVSYYFPPDTSPGSLRMGAFVNRLRALGWQIRAVTARDPAGGRAGTNPTDLDPDVIVEETRSFDLYWHVHRAATTSSPSRADRRAAADGESGRRRPLWRRVAKALFSGIYELTRFPDKRAGWMWPLFFRALRMIRRERVDVVFSSSPPHSSQVALAMLRRVRRFRWVVDMRDPWTAPRRHGKSRASRRVQQWLENWVLTSCDAVVANTEGNRRALLDAFPAIAPDKVTVITNGYDDRVEVPASPPYGDIADSDIAYVGEVYAGMLDTYLAALRIIRSRAIEPLPVLHVYGKVDAGESAKVAAAGLEDVIVFKGVVSPAQSLSVMRAARSLLLLLPYEDHWRTCVPSKTYPYLFAGPPVLALVPEGDAARIVRDTEAGSAIASEDPERVADAIVTFVSACRSGTEQGARDPVLTSPYTFTSLAARLDALFQSLHTRSEMLD